jgi:mRNA-degrading endonuclease RelE of RelBE toxin-antitoxin system
MSYKVELTDNFIKEAKKLLKKYPSLKIELELLGKRLIENPTLGTHIGNNIYKIRLAVKSKGKGKRGGTRVMTYVVIANEKVFLFAIYNKGEKDDISDQEIHAALSEIINQ